MCGIHLFDYISSIYKYTGDPKKHIEDIELFPNYCNDNIYKDEGISGEISVSPWIVEKTVYFPTDSEKELLNNMIVLNPDKRSSIEEIETYIRDTLIPKEKFIVKTQKQEQVRYIDNLVPIPPYIAEFVYPCTNAIFETIYFLKLYANKLCLHNPEIIQCMNLYLVYLKATNGNLGMSTAYFCITILMLVSYRHDTGGVGDFSSIKDIDNFQISTIYECANKLINIIGYNFFTNTPDIYFIEYAKDTVLHYYLVLDHCYMWLYISYFSNLHIEYSSDIIGLFCYYMGCISTGVKFNYPINIQKDTIKLVNMRNSLYKTMNNLKKQINTSKLYPLVSCGYARGELAFEYSI